ncbi:MAG: hypothetical protein NZM04_11085 [Methylacidiphilales bacterium]|nr:hypothetical protein [Candidatus Methylacidiphilales bacterium]
MWVGGGDVGGVGARRVFVVSWGLEGFLWGVGSWEAFCGVLFWWGVAGVFVGCGFWGVGGVYLMG